MNLLNDNINFLSNVNTKKRKRSNNSNRNINIHDDVSLSDDLLLAQLSPKKRTKQQKSNKSVGKLRVNDTISFPACMDSDLNPSAYYSFKKLNSINSDDNAPQYSPSKKRSTSSTILNKVTENQEKCFGCTHISNSLPLLEDKALDNLIFLYKDIQHVNINIHCYNIHEYYETKIRSKYVKIENGVKKYLLPEWTPQMIKNHLLYHQTDAKIHIQLMMQKLTTSIYHIFQTCLHTKEIRYIDNYSEENDENQQKKKANKNGYKESRNNNDNSILNEFNPFQHDAELEEEGENYFDDDEEGNGVNDEHSDELNTSTAVNFERINGDLSEVAGDDYQMINEKEKESNVNIYNFSDSSLKNHNEISLERYNMNMNMTNAGLDTEDMRSREETAPNLVVDYNSDLIGKEKGRKYIIQYGVNLKMFAILDKMIKTFVYLGLSNPEEKMKPFCSPETSDKAGGEGGKTKIPEPFFAKNNKNTSISDDLDFTRTTVTKSMKENPNINNYQY